MIVVWEDQEYKWNFSKYHKRKSRKGKSKLHTICRDLLLSTYKMYSLYEEVTLPGLNLYADFFLTKPLIVEVHGRQHYEFVPHFHSTQANFLKSQKRDKDKKYWAASNNIEYVELPYNRIDEWKTMLP